MTTINIDCYIIAAAVGFEVGWRVLRRGERTSHWERVARFLAVLCLISFLEDVRHPAFKPCPVQQEARSSR
jgi:uncharacterized membrane protein SpoIIM required for sporulation